ncbi:MAG: hypothetical protein KC419_04680 [Anaerolineales bacterium]|nr:hypothetical protein [Anaerolineales bacterium]
MIYKQVRKVSLLLLILCIFGMFIFTVNAASSSKRKSNFAGVTDAVAEKVVGSTSDYTQIVCRSKSYTDNPAINITHVGYNTFSCTAWRNTKSSGNIISQWSSPSGEVNWNAQSHFKEKSIGAPAILGTTRIGVAAGVHDFGHFNGVSYDWDPSLSAEQTFYP